jgi:DNA-binding Lrp family transcriptional regulator
MNAKKAKTILANTPEQWRALAYPLRIEIIGLFTTGDALSIADMGRMMGRPAGSLYHHVKILEGAGLLKRTGTRPRGKRYEALFVPTAARYEVDTSSGGDEAITHAVKAISSAFRMAERDLEAALQDDRTVAEGPGRNLYAGRLHMRATPALLAAINQHLSAIEELVNTEIAKRPEPAEDVHHMSLTFALLPIKGRGFGASGQGN